MRAVIYCRVSTAEQAQDEHYSIPNQLQRCRDYASLKKWHAPQVLVDVASGKNDRRSSFRELQALIAAHQVDLILVYRLDRLSRNVRDIYAFLERIQKKNISFVSVTEGFDTTTAMGRAMLGMAAIFAQLTREIIGENTKDGKALRADAGFYNGRVNLVHGYTYDEESHLLKPVPSEAAQVRQMFDRYTCAGWSTEGIAQAMNAEGVATRTGVVWTTGLIQRMLANPVFAGHVRAGHRLAAGKHEALISAQQFGEAQILLKRQRQNWNETHRKQYLLSGIATCGVCGRLLNGHLSSGSRKRGEEMFRNTIYKHHPTRGNVLRPCQGVAKSGHRLEGKIVSALQELRVGITMSEITAQGKASSSLDHHEQIAKSPSLSCTTTSRNSSYLSSSGKRRVFAHRMNTQRLKALDLDFEHWASLVDSGAVTPDEFTEANTALLRRKQHLRSAIDAYKSWQAGHEAWGIQAKPESLTEDADHRMIGVIDHWERWTDDERHNALQEMIESLQVWKTHAILEVRSFPPISISLNFSRPTADGKVST